MPDHLLPYPAYKNSGVPWLGDVPAHWEVKRQRNVVHMLVSNIDKHTVEGQIPVRLCNYVDVYKNDRITEHLSFMRATASSDEINRFRLQVGDVIITKDSEMWNDIGVPALVEYEAPDLVCGYHLAILRPRRGIVHGSFLLQALQSQGVASQYYVSANGVTRYGLSHDAIKSVLVPVPPPDEQLAIARYLDHVDHRIRRAIRAKQRLIALLNEQKQAIIHRAVTRGLDPSVRLKPSGVAWLGEVPEHWEIKRMRSLVGTIDQGKSPQAEAALADDHSWGILKAGCVNHGVFRDTEHKRLPSGYVIDQRFVVRIGDVLVSRACGSPKLVGSVGRVHTLSFKLILSDKTFRLNFLDQRLMDFLVYAMNSRYYRIQTEQAISGAEGLANNLPLTKLRGFRLAVPPPSEAIAIAKQLQREIGVLDRSISDAQHQIVLLREYRTRLIADVVTGKVDVRAAAQGLPDEVEEMEPLDEVEALGDTGEETNDDLEVALREDAE